jgi:hypothetical protein
LRIFCGFRGFDDSSQPAKSKETSAAAQSRLMEQNVERSRRNGENLERFLILTNPE